MYQSIELTELTKLELLMLAAKSIGFDPYVHGGKLYSEFQYEGEETTAKDWDPMKDPADAMLLAIELQLTVHNDQLGSGTAYCTKYDFDRHEEITFPEVLTINNSETLTKQDYRDSYRAIVYAAATIALEMINNEQQTQGS